MNDAVVLFSGGLDSTTCLFLAKKQHDNIYALSVNYKQRHQVELSAAQKIAEICSVTEHKIIEIDLRLFGKSALTDIIEVPKDRQGTTEHEIPITYVPARNLILLSLASAYAESKNVNFIYIGANQIDYSGYPDCRPAFITSFEKTLNLATRQGVDGNSFQICTPLIDLTKKEIVLLATKLKAPLELTFSCYDPIIRENKALPCGHCDSCILRQKGFKEANISDRAMKGIEI